MTRPRKACGRFDIFGVITFLWPGIASAKYFSLLCHRKKTRNGVSQLGSLIWHDIIGDGLSAGPTVA
jgi:hypothetical protein